MNHIKLFENYLNDKIKKTLEEIKSEVDQYMYYITDNYQIDSTDDFFEITKENKIEIYYCNLTIDSLDDFKIFKDKILKLNKVIEKEFDFKMEFIAQRIDNGVINLFNNSKRSLDFVLKTGFLINISKLSSGGRYFAIKLSEK